VEVSPTPFTGRYLGRPSFLCQAIESGHTSKALESNSFWWSALGPAQRGIWGKCWLYRLRADVNDGGGPAGEASVAVVASRTPESKLLVFGVVHFFFKPRSSCSSNRGDPSADTSRFSTSSGLIPATSRARRALYSTVTSAQMESMFTYTRVWPVWQSEARLMTVALAPSPLQNQPAVFSKLMRGLSSD
jgi:hypothetical protein